MVLCKVCNGQGRRLTEVSDVADLEVGLSQISIASTGKRKRSLTVENVVVTLNQGSVDALNGFFGTAFAAGDVLGDASVKTRIVGRFPA